MRLLSTKKPSDGEPELCLEEFFGTGIPKYAILSHTWSQPRNEVQYSDLLNSTYEGKSGLSKVRGAMRQARQDGLHYVWIDSVCIDRSSSSELSEAINSMYRLYQLSQTCYVYLADVDTPILDETNFDPDAQFCKSRWWTRGWTLQELLAPRRVRFFSSTWECLGDKFCKITTINLQFLTGTVSLERASVAKRMSWAASRETTRVEDIAYCLLGMFSVNMPMLYGEGTHAFVRLQEEIIKTTDDHSIFAWRSKTPGASHGLLADSPKAFAGSGEVVPYVGWQGRKPFGMTNVGLDIELPLLESCEDDEELPELDSDSVIRYSRPEEPTFTAAIACRSPKYSDSYLGLRLRALPGNSNQFTRVDCETFYTVSSAVPPIKFYVPQDITISRAQLGMPTYQSVLLRSYGGVRDWKDEEKTQGIKRWHTIKSRGTIRQYDSTSLPDRISVYQRLGRPQPSINTDLIFVVGLARNRPYGWIMFERASDMAIIMIVVGRLLNGEIGFDILRVYDKDAEVIDSIIWSLRPLGCWMDVGGFPTQQARIDVGEDKVKFEGTLEMRSRYDDQVYDVDVLTNPKVANRSVELANFINSRARLIARRGFSW